ncbi:MAG: alpha/beta hydrolase [Bacteroidota bacterium]
MFARDKNTLSGLFYLYTVHGSAAGITLKWTPILRTRGDVVYRPTLTGLGERVHLSNTNIDLTTYISDIANVIKFEGLHDVILVGHSFGGMVISGVAEQMPGTHKPAHLFRCDGA